jgi:SAM-dependent methyltransferase
MTVENPPRLVKTLAGRHGEASERAGFTAPLASSDARAWADAFEEAYTSACGELGAVPWRAGHPDPALVAWLDHHAPSLIRPGAAAAVVGCGTGDDAAELAARGYDITALDVAPTAIAWARQRFPHIADCFLTADVLNPPRHLLRRSDLVVDSDALAWLPAELRPSAAAGLTALARPRGMVLVISSTSGDEGASRSAMSTDELTALMAEQGMVPLCDALEDGVELVGAGRRMCAAFRRG